MDPKLPEWDASAQIEVRYANCFRVGSNENEMVIEFAQCSSNGTSIRAHSRIVTHPDYARNLVRILRTALEDSQRAKVTREEPL